VTAAVGLEPLTTQTGFVLALLFEAASDANDGANVPKLIPEIERAGVFDRNDDSTGGIRVTPLPAAVDSHEAVVKVVRPIVYPCDVTDYDPPRSVDIDIAERGDDEGSKPISIEVGIHPLLLGDIEDASA
jgi:hypothetical protein